MSYFRSHIKLLSESDYLFSIETYSDW